MSKRKKGNRKSKVTTPDRYITLATAIANLITALIILYQKMQN